MKTGEHKNQHGILVSDHVCDTCGEPFTVTPAVDNKDWENCQAKICKSYDPKRDADPLFSGQAPTSPVIELDAHRPHRTLEVICVKCCKRWIAIAPIDTPLVKYECPKCGPGYVASTGQWDA